MQFIEKIGYKSKACVRAKIENIDYYPFHLHNDAIEIICVLDGTVDIRDSAASYTLGYGDVHVFNRDDPHKITAHRGDDGKPEDNIILTIHLDCRYYKSYFDKLDTMYFITDTYNDRDIYTSDMRHLRFLMAKIFREYTGDCSDLALEYGARDLLEYLSLYFTDYVYREDEPWTAHIVRLQSRHKNYDRMYRIVDDVFEHYNEKITLRAFAAREFLSEEHLSRYMRDTLGLTFSQLLSLTRCEEASKLLSSSDKTVDQIASAVGFANRKHMATHFRRWYKQTPTDYRREIKKDLKTGSKIVFKPFDFDYSQRIIEIYLDEY